MIRSILLAIAFLGSFMAAQSAKIESAPAESPPPLSSPKKLPNKLEKPPEPETPKRNPEEIVTTFFDALKADRVDAAYDSLKTEFAMADRGSEGAKGMREQTQKALDAYGPMFGYEMIHEEKIGVHLMRRTYLLIGEVLPLRWKFYFYRPDDRWFLIDLRIDDTIPSWFDEAAKSPK